MRKLIATLALIAAITVGAASPSDAATAHSHHRKPTRSEVQFLRMIQREMGHRWHCVNEWNQIQRDYEAVCSPVKR